jgi:hypothetical protein
MNCASVNEVEESTGRIALVVEGTLDGLSRDFDASTEVPGDVITPERALVSTELVSIVALLARSGFDNSSCVTVEISSAIEVDAVCPTTSAAVDIAERSDDILSEIVGRATTLESTPSGSSNASDTFSAFSEDEPTVDGLLFSNERVSTLAFCKSELIPVAFARISEFSVDTDESTDSSNCVLPNERMDCSKDSDISSVVGEEDDARIGRELSAVILSVEVEIAATVTGVFIEISTSNTSAPATPYGEPPYVIYSQVFTDKSDRLPSVSISSDLPLGTWTISRLPLLFSVSRTSSFSISFGSIVKGIVVFYFIYMR